MSSAHAGLGIRGEGIGTAPPPRPLAPFGRRLAPIVARERHGAYVVLRCQDQGGPRPQAGQFYMLAAAQRWGAGEGQRPFLPRAFSILQARGDAGRLELDFLLEDVGPGTRRLCELDAGEDLSLVGPLGRGFASPRDGRRPLLVGGGVGIAPLAIWQDQLGGGAPALLGFRDGSRALGAALLNGARVAGRCNLPRGANSSTASGCHDLPRTGGRDSIHNSVIIPAAQLRVIECVERFSAQLEPHTLRDIEIFK